MKLQLLFALFALLAATVLATQRGRGIEFVDSLSELPSGGAPLAKGESYVSHDGSKRSPEPKASAAGAASKGHDLDKAYDNSLIQLGKSVNMAQVSPKQAELMKAMDPFAAKHYAKGFKIGMFGRPKIERSKKQKSFFEARLLEDCMACRFVWKNVEMDVGNTEQQKVVYDSFINQCKLAMKAPIMYMPCQHMYGRVDNMVTGYAAGMTVEEVCAQARLCR